MSIRTRWVCAWLLLITAMPVAWPILPAQAKPPLKPAIKRQLQRDEFIHFENIVDSLGITEGMTILDIGSGPGYASFLFAEKLRGSGGVYATDVREDFVRYIAEEAARRGLNNLHPVVVKSEGMDEFYGRHRYDLVFLSNVYHCLDRRVDYFRKLRGYLKPNARLVLILYDQAPLFSVDDLSDVDSIVEGLSGDPDDDPFHEHLSPRTRQWIEEGSQGEEFRKALVEDFNRMLVDPLFYKGFYSNSYFRKGLFTEIEREFANWLLMTLEEDGVLEKSADRIDPRAMRSVIRLNRLFFRKHFGDYLAGDGMGTYIPAGDANRHTSKYAVFRELDAAGYKLAKEFKLSPFFDAVVMEPGTP